MILQIAGTMSSRSASRHCDNRIYSTGPVVVYGRVFGSRQLQQITSLSLMLMRTWTDKASSGAAHLIHQPNFFLVNVTVHSSDGGHSPVQISFGSANASISNTTYSGTSDTPFIFTVPSPRLWSPDSPTLYNLTVTMGDDHVTSYSGFRTISKGVVDGVVRPLLNGEFIFMFGILDQGYWPDGLYTPPSREAMVYDLEVLKSLGFNMLRKHVSCSPNPYRTKPDLFTFADQSRDSTVLPSLWPNGSFSYARYASASTFAELFPSQLHLGDYFAWSHPAGGIWSPAWRPCQPTQEFPKYCYMGALKSRILCTWSILTNYRWFTMRDGVKWSQDIPSLASPIESGNLIPQDSSTVRLDGTIMELEIIVWVYPSFGDIVCWLAALGQPPLRKFTMRHSFLLNPVKPIRPLSHRIPRWIRWNRKNVSIDQ